MLGPRGAVTWKACPGCARVRPQGRRCGQVLAAPAACCPCRSAGVRLICTNQVGNGARTTVVNTQSGATIRWAWGAGGAASNITGLLAGVLCPQAWVSCADPVPDACMTSRWLTKDWRRCECCAAPPRRDNILAVFGSKAADAMQPLHVRRPAAGKPPRTMFAWS